MGDVEVWRERLDAVGHTGWRNAVIYAYDQLERKQIVSQVLARLDLPEARVAVDFGCGTGDFSRLLIERGFSVHAYDPYVTPRWTHDRLFPAGSLEELRERVSDADLVLSVTVLDHITDGQQFEATLDSIRGFLRTGGYLCAMEYALDNEEPTPPGMQPNDFQSFRTLGAWEKALIRTQFDLVEYFPVPHPIENPSRGYRRYRSSLAVKLLRRTRALRTERGRRLLTALARRAVERHPPDLEHQRSSPMNCLVCRAC